MNNAANTNQLFEAAILTGVAGVFLFLFISVPEIMEESQTYFNSLFSDLEQALRNKRSLY